MADIIGGLVSYGLNTRSQERSFEQQKELQSNQQAYNTLMFNASNAYNSPVNQMARFNAAGLNPNLIYGQMANISSPVSSGLGSSPSPASVQMSALETAQIGLINAQRDNIMEDTRLKESQGSLNASYESLNASQERLNEIVGSLNDAQRKYYDAQVPLIGQQVYNAFEEGRKLNIEADNYNEYIRSQIDNLDANSFLNYSQAYDLINTFEARVNELKARAYQEGWDAQKLQSEVELLGETIVQEQIATKVKEAEGEFETSNAYQWISHGSEILSRIVGSVGGIILGFAGLKGARALRSGRSVNTARIGAESGYTTSGFGMNDVPSSVRKAMKKTGYKSSYSSTTFHK